MKLLSEPCVVYFLGFGELLRAEAYFGFAWSLRIANNVSSIHFISQNGMPFWLKDQDPDPSRSKTFKVFQRFLWL